MANRTKLTPKKKKEFCERLVLNGGNVSAACRALRINRVTVYEHCKRFPEFAQAMDQAVDQGIDTLEDEAKRRAYNGTLEAIYYQGKKVGSKRVYSDFLMGMMLKAHRTKYKERHEVTGPNGQPLNPPITPAVVQFVIPDDGRGGAWAPGQPAPEPLPPDEKETLPCAGE